MLTGSDSWVCKRDILRDGFANDGSSRIKPDQAKSINQLK